MRQLLKLLLVALTAAILLARSPAAHAQGTTEPVIRDSNVGYIDPALPGDVFRFRFDAAYGNTRPTRDEFFWSPGAPFGHGPSIPERSVDYQDLLFYCEHAFNAQTSAFINVPVRFLNPELNPNTAGLADIDAGFKYAFFDSEDLVATAQFRVYAPTGDSDRGLGDAHVSLEPALLVYRPLGDGWVMEGELRDWIPVGGGDFAGNIVRYGVGAHYDRLCRGKWQMAPVVELVGWTALGGKVSMVEPNEPPIIVSAAGETIVNVKVGLRVKCSDFGDFYMGYGRPLTGDNWYQNTLRVEMRIFL